MTAMIVEDVAVVVVIALFVWLVPIRRNGIPGLRGRGRVPSRTTRGEKEPPTGRGARRFARPTGPKSSSWPTAAPPRWVPIDSRGHKHSA